MAVSTVLLLVTENCINNKRVNFVVIVQSLSHVRLSVTPWTGVLQALPLSPGVCSNSRPLSQLSNHLILCHPFHVLPSVFPSIRLFSNESALQIRWLKYWTAAEAAVLPMNIQGWFPLGLTGSVSLRSKLIKWF